MLFQHPANAQVSDTSGASLYRIHVQDVLQIKNMQNVKYIADDPTSTQGSRNDDEGQTYTVEPDGTVGLPVLGRIKIAGLTRFDAENKLDQLYGEKLIKNPVIQVKIINLKVTLMGEVRTPGNYPLLKDQTSLVEVLGEAGGVTDKADAQTVKVVRGNPANPQVFEIDLSKLNALTFMMESHDIVYVVKNKRAVRNEKMQNFTTTAQPALLLLNTVLLAFTLARQ